MTADVTREQLELIAFDLIHQAAQSIEAIDLSEGLFEALGETNDDLIDMLQDTIDDAFVQIDFEGPETY